jgi:hypothetical protein
VAVAAVYLRTTTCFAQRNLHDIEARVCNNDQQRNSIFVLVNYLVKPAGDALLMRKIQNDDNEYYLYSTYLLEIAFTN